MYYALVVIGGFVFIGMLSLICNSVTTGNHEEIASGAVVTKDIPVDEVGIGVPAKFIKIRQ